jgi:hypothetical protein
LLTAVTVLLAARAPLDRVLGTSVRVVYLHGAMVWVALLGFTAAGLTGLAAWPLRRDRLHAWSVGLGRSATIFWLMGLLLSLAAMEISWNGLFLAEPRWQFMLRFGIAAVLLQIAVTLVGRPAVGSAVNLLFIVLLAAGLSATPLVMHPSSPVFSSGSSAIRASFLAILTTATAAAAVLSWLLRPNA